MNCHDAARRALPLSRRAFLRTIGTGVIGAGALAAGCNKPASPSGGDFRGQTITVFVYSGLDKIFQEHFVEPFEARTGATIILDAGWWDSIGKLKASPKRRPAY